MDLDGEWCWCCVSLWSYASCLTLLRWQNDTRWCFSEQISVKYVQFGVFVDSLFDQVKLRQKKGKWGES